MNKGIINWKKGRGKLGLFKPLLGSWIAEQKSEMGYMKCTRTFKQVLNGNYIELNAKWEFGGKIYEEISIFGAEKDTITFWSFTSDGKKSNGYLANASDIHPDAICFEAQMPAGLARMIYWPDQNSGFRWAVENKVKNGWNRFTEHSYKSIF